MQLDGQLVPIELVPIILVTKRKGDKDSPSLWSVTRFRRFYQAFCRAREPRSSLGAKSFGDSLTTFLLFFVKKYKYTTIYLQVHVYKSTNTTASTQIQLHKHTNPQRAAAKSFCGSHIGVWQPHQVFAIPAPMKGRLLT